MIGVHSAKFMAEKATEAVREAVLRYGVTHPVVNDRDLRVWDAYAVRLWPTMMFIDPRGKVIARHEGEVPVETFDRTLAEMVTEFDAKGWLDRRPLTWRPERLTTSSVLAFPGKLLADHASSRLFVADTNHHRIIVSDLIGKVQRVIGTGEAGLSDEPVRFDSPQGLALDGDLLYVADTGNHALRKVNLTSGAVETVAGNGEQARIYYRHGGPGPTIKLNSPWDMTLAEGELYLTMAGFHQVWRFDSASGLIQPWVGSGHEGLKDGPFGEALLAQPSGISYRAGQFYLACSEASAIRRFDPVAGQVTTLVGEGLYEFGDREGVGEVARLQHPLGVEAGPDGLLYVADTYNHKIKRLNPTTRELTRWLGDGTSGYHDGPGATARFNEPGGLSLAGNKLYIADTNNHAVRVADLATGEVTTLEFRGI